MEEYNRTINQLHLLDLLTVERKYMWSNLRENPSLAKLNKILVLPEWETHFSMATVGIYHKLTSDHVTLKLNLGVMERRNRRPFRFKKMWIVVEDLEGVIKQSWVAPTRATDAAANMSKKLGRLRKTQRKCERVSIGNIKQRKETINTEIEG